MAKKRLTTQQPSVVPAAKASVEISKNEAIRRAIGVGHLMAKPGVEYILKTFGLEVSPAVYSAQKSKLKAKTMQQALAVRKQAKDLPAETPTLTMAAMPGRANVLEDVKLVKGLVDRHGAGAVLQMVELFER